MHVYQEDELLLHIAISVIVFQFAQCIQNVWHYFDLNK